MEYKFKTIWKNQLINCEISTWENAVFMKSNEYYTAIGKIRDVGIRENGLPLLPIYPYTGKKDRYGQEIYLDHRLKINLFDLIALVVWDEDKAGFYLKPETESGRLLQFESDYCESAQCEIVDHAHVIKKHNGVTA